MSSYREAVLLGEATIANTRQQTPPPLLDWDIAMRTAQPLGLDYLPPVALKDAARDHEASLRILADIVDHSSPGETSAEQRNQYTQSIIRGDLIHPRSIATGRGNRGIVEPEMPLASLRAIGRPANWDVTSAATQQKFLHVAQGRSDGRTDKQIAKRLTTPYSTVKQWSQYGIGLGGHNLTGRILFAHVLGLPIEVSDGLRQPVVPLTHHQARVAILTAFGFDKAEVATHLNASFATIRTHLVDFKAKAGIHKREEVPAALIRLGHLVIQPPNETRLPDA